MSESRSPLRPVPQDGTRLRPTRWGRRRWARAAAGLALTAGCVGGFLLAAAHLDHRRDVWAAARPLPAGHVLTRGDLRATRVAVEARVPTIAADQLVTGQALRAPVMAEQLLAPALLGAGSWPPAGRVLLAVSVKPGAYPPDLSAGARVAVLPISASPAGNTAANPPTTSPPGLERAADAHVVSLTGVADQPGTRVVELLAADADAARIAALPAGGAQILQRPPSETS